MSGRLVRRHSLGVADEIGDENAPVDSRPWLKWLYRKAVSLKHDAEFTAVALKDYLSSLRRGERWRRLDDRDGRAFTSWEDFYQYPEPFGLGMSLQQVAAIVEEPDGSARTVAAVLGKHGGDRRSEKAREQDSQTTSIGRGSDYLKARLERDHPEIAARLDQYPSVKAAAREAGIVKPADPYRQLCKWWRVASEEQRAEFEDYIAAWRHREGGRTGAPIMQVALVRPKGCTVVALPSRTGAPSPSWVTARPPEPSQAPEVIAC